MDPLASDGHIIAKGGWFFNRPPDKSCLCVRCQSSFTLMSKQGNLSDIFTIIALLNIFNLLADVRHDVRPLVCLFIKVFAILATGAAGFEPATDRLTADSSAVELHPIM